MATGETPSIDLFRNPPDLERELHALLRQIPPGRVTTYGALARVLGDRVAARWVGEFMLAHDHGGRCACHRVVRSDGSLGRYVEASQDTKARRLAAEQVEIVNGKVDLIQFRFDSFSSNRPLERLRQLQLSMLPKHSLDSRRGMPCLVAGVDVSYAQPEDENQAHGVAAYALVDRSDGELVWSTTVRQPVRFPYISSFLAFRELPILLELFELVRQENRLADVVLVDGSGILHPRGAGIATLLGMAGDVATVGVTKKLLCGRVVPSESEPRTIEHDGRPAGCAFRSTAGAKKPIYVSPGNGVNLGYCRRLIPSLMHGHKLPEPLFWADKLSRIEAQSGG